MSRRQKGAVLERPIDRLLWEVIYTQTYDLLDAARVGCIRSDGDSGVTAVFDGGRKACVATLPCAEGVAADRAGLAILSG